MPTFHMRCLCCGIPKTVLGKHAGMPKCKTPGCSGYLTRDSAGPTAGVVERLDNGAMVRAVERPRDAERMNEERRLNADPAAGTVQSDRHGQLG